MIDLSNFLFFPRTNDSMLLFINIISVEESFFNFYRYSPISSRSFSLFYLSWTFTIITPSGKYLKMSLYSYVIVSKATV